MTDEFDDMFGEFENIELEGETDVVEQPTVAIKVEKKAEKTQAETKPYVKPTIIAGKIGSTPVLFASHTQINWENTDSDDIDKYLDMLGATEYVKTKLPISQKKTYIKDRLYNISSAKANEKKTNIEQKLREFDFEQKSIIKNLTEEEKNEYIKELVDKKNKNYDEASLKDEDIEKFLFDDGWWKDKIISKKEKIDENAIEFDKKRIALNDLRRAVEKHTRRWQGEETKGKKTVCFMKINDAFSNTYTPMGKDAFNNNNVIKTIFEDKEAKQFVKDQLFLTNELGIYKDRYCLKEEDFDEKGKPKELDKMPLWVANIYKDKEEIPIIEEIIEEESINGKKQEEIEVESVEKPIAKVEKEETEEQVLSDEDNFDILFS